MWNVIKMNRQQIRSKMTMAYIHVLHKASHRRDNLSFWGSQCRSRATVRNLSDTQTKMISRLAIMKSVKESKTMNGSKMRSPWNDQ